MANSSGIETVNGQGIVAKAGEVATLMAGKPYTWGGKTLNGFDCSGFVSYVLKQLYPNFGPLLDTNVAGYISSSLFVDVNESDRQPGDIIIFPASGGVPAHIGIVYDDVFWIGSQSSTGVAKVKFSNPWWSTRLRNYRRVNSLSTAAIDLGRFFPVCAIA